jgi:multiple sugar transport system ATP-binding protein
LYVRGSGFSVRIPDERRGAVSNVKADGVVLGVRSEDVLFRGDGGAPIPAVVDVVEPLGPEQVVYLNVGGSQVTARAAPDFAVTSGDAVDVAINANRIHLFDATSGVAYF